MSPESRLTVRELRVRAVNVPMRLPLQTSGGTIEVAPLVLIDLVTGQGVTGSTYLFCYTPLALKPVVALLTDLGEALQGDPVVPLELERRLHGRFRLLGAKGIVAMALAGIDMAAWDALARAQELPLARMLGGMPQPVRAYNSCGLGMIGAERAAAEAQTLTEPGFGAIKLRLGYPQLSTDLEVVRRVRRAVGADIRLMADYNQALSVAESMHRIRALDDEGLEWIEEPTLADDCAGAAQIRAAAATAIQMGENWWGPHDMARCLAAGGTDLAMPDAMKIGGVSGWLRASTLAATGGVPMSSHLFPEISAHLLAVTPTRDWLEYVDWAAPILEQPLQIVDGCVTAGDQPGSGIRWNEAAVRRYLVQ